MNPNIFGVIGSGFLNQVATLQLLNFSLSSPSSARLRTEGAACPPFPITSHFFEQTSACEDFFNGVLPRD